MFCRGKRVDYELEFVGGGRWRCCGVRCGDEGVEGLLVFRLRARDLFFSGKSDFERFVRVGVSRVFWLVLTLIYWFLF